MDEAENFSKKDSSIVSYLGGYVFGTFYRRIRCSLKNTGLYSQQCLSFLIAGKCIGENVTLPEHKSVNILVVYGKLMKMLHLFSKLQNVILG